MDVPLRHFQESLDRVNRALNYVTQMYLGKRGLGMSRFWVLMRLYNKGQTNMSTMQKYMFLSSATLTGLVDNLVDDGLVVRTREGEDRRMVHLRLTAAGNSLCKEVLDYRSFRLRDALAGSSADLAKTTELLDGIFAGLKEQNVLSLNTPDGNCLKPEAHDDTGK